MQLDILSHSAPPRTSSHSSGRDTCDRVPAHSSVALRRPTRRGSSHRCSTIRPTCATAPRTPSPRREYSGTTPEPAPRHGSARLRATADESDVWQVCSRCFSCLLLPASRLLLFWKPETGNWKLQQSAASGTHPPDAYPIFLRYRDSSRRPRPPPAPAPVPIVPAQD